ncbi:chloride channel protein [Mycobacterium sp. CVI_P3]|uniref:Chloride channel protein n=1 Tax=Mycobacterium pinniadriaticum TaxID=2994102 RepID=A0ABT3S7M1_9MYCO|nr:chloride channel protein [Mycobacterium pinniadriaticum]MCX2929068.1 chloride channel protein [Mycobacterium pinniadriaticum]MCX2935493.1 chloride channel protein [Mycobacterium pinniadriaticum]
MNDRLGMPRRIPVPRRAQWVSWLRGSTSALVALAIAVGAVTGLGAVGFRFLITFFTRMFTGYEDYSGLGRIPSTHWPWLGVWFLLLAPVVAGAVYGPIVHHFAPEARGHGVPEVMYAVSHKGGRIAPQVTLVKALASALCIGGGGSVGREGPIVQIGSAAGSTVAQILRLDVSRVRLLVACGAAAGISATFNAPLAGPFFAMELILRDFAAQSFGAVVLSSVAADVVGRAMLGNHPFLSLPSFAVRSPTEYLLYVVLGIAVGVVGVAFSKILYLVEDACDWLWRGPEWARPAVGGLLLGAVLLALPQMYGVGYPVLENAVEGHYLIGMLVLLMVGKMFATSLTIGIGGSGGVFAPTLFIGAMAGTAFGTIAHDLFPGVTESAGAYGLIGMGAALGGATRAPITAVVILFELTGEYSIILPLMAAVVMAAGTGHLLSKDTIYTAKLWRRGIDLDRPPPELPDLRAADLAVPAPDPLAVDCSLGAAAKALADTAFGMLPVVTGDGRYAGCVAAQDVAEALEGANAPPVISDLVQPATTIGADAKVRDVLNALKGRGGTGLPVLDSDRTSLIGWVTYETVLSRLHPEPGPAAPSATA